MQCVSYKTISDFNLLKQIVLKKQDLIIIVLIFIKRHLFKKKKKEKKKFVHCAQAKKMLP